MAGAKHSKHSKHALSQQGRYGSRIVGIRKTLPVIALVCDDTEAAPAYFELIKRKVKPFVTLRVVPAPCTGASPRDVVGCAIEVLDGLRECQGDDELDRDSVWALVDLEHDQSRRNQAFEARKWAQTKGVKVALSDPCFEIWTLLHLEDTGTKFDDCGQVLERIKQLWLSQFQLAFGPKAQADYSKIIDLRLEALSRAKAHRKREDPSWTEVHLIIEDIESQKLIDVSSVPHESREEAADTKM